jgi:succinate-semialdehyde dehydrogenase/glutarate-semialdehyde dehydrogenase
MGQICIAVNRIYVQREVYPAFVARFVESARRLTWGEGIAQDVDLGPMCTQKGVKTVQLHVDDAVAKGAKLSCGGKSPVVPGYENGNWYEPTILAEADHTMLIMQEETFGPAVGVMPFDTLDEAIRLANDTPYGLAAIVYTQNLTTADTCARQIQAGNVAVNNVDAGVINAPYGGIKASGFGKEHGPEGLYEYLVAKHIRIRVLPG